MESLFIGLTEAVSGTPLVALAAALAWGMLSVILSPCHLASIPLIVAFIGGQGRTGTGRVFTLSSLALGSGGTGWWRLSFSSSACTCSTSSPRPGRHRGG